MTDENPVTPPGEVPAQPPVQPPVVPPAPSVQPPEAPPVQPPAPIPPAPVPPAAVQPPVQPPAPVPPAYAAPAPVPPTYAPPGGVPPVVPPTYAQPAYGAAPAPKKRKLWPLFLIGGVILLILLTVGGFVVANVVSAANHERDLESVEQAVRDFDSSYEEVDCDAFEEVTTKDFRKDYAKTYYDASSFDCDDWEADAEALSEDGDYLYDVEVNKVVVYTNDATVRTTEQADGNDAVDFVYELERIGGSWVITAYEED